MRERYLSATVEQALGALDQAVCGQHGLRGLRRDAGKNRPPIRHARGRARDTAMTEAMHQVLVIEDEPGIRAVLRVLLTAEGYRCIEADTALRAEIEGSWDGKPPPPERYVDLSYYENALKKILR